LRSIRVIVSSFFAVFLMQAKAGYSLPDNYEVYFKAEEAFKNQDLEEALKSYQEFFKTRPSSELVKDVYPKIAEAFYNQKKYKSAQDVLSHFLTSRKKKFRRLGIVRPQVLSLYLKTQERLKQDFNCKLARELFSDFPEYSAISTWSSIMSKNKIDDRTINCEVDIDLIKARIKNLLWHGLFERADFEITELDQKTQVDKFEIAWLKSMSLSHQGNVQQALDLMLPFYSLKNKNEEFLYYLGLLATRAGIQNLAIYIYDELSDLYINHKSKLKAIHQSALTCYQFTDYDCALSRWEKIKNFGNFRSMQKEVLWYIAWTKYLRGQYQQAEMAFENLLKQPIMKDQESKLTYWLAKTKSKNSKFSEAKSFWTQLINKSPVSYYTYLAAFEMGLKKKDDSLSDSASESLPKEELGSSNESLSLEVNTEAGFINESEESEDDLEKSTVVESKDLTLKLSRLQDLFNLGHKSLVLSELKLIESHVKESKDLQTLAAFYLKNNFYQRSSYIGQVYLTSHFNIQQREAASNELKLAFPNAFNDVVTKQAQNTQVPRALVWGIMKAESQFNETAVSAVGARGLMQLMPFTADKINQKILQKRDFASDDLFSPESSIQIGALYLQNLNNKFLNQPALTAAAYNAGPHRVQNWSKYFGYLTLEEFVEHIPFSETRNYVKKVTSHLQVYNQLYEKNEKTNYSMIGPIRYNYNGAHVLKEEW